MASIGKTIRDQYILHRASIALRTKSLSFLLYYFNRLQKQGLLNNKLTRKHYMDRVYDHTIRVLDSDEQIGVFGTLMCATVRSGSNKGFAKLFIQNIAPDRVQRNAEYITTLKNSVRPIISYPTKACHDIGKVKDEAAHEEHSARMFMRDKLYRYFQIKRRIDILIIKCSIRYHGLLAGTTIGEYSPLAFMRVLFDPDVRKVMRAGYMGEFLDNLTLLNICDLAGKKGFVPLHSKIEDYRRSNIFLKKLSDKILSLRYSKEQVSHILGSHSILSVGEKLARYVSASDQDIDLNTRHGRHDLYTEIMDRALDGMIKDRTITRADRDHFSEFCSLMRSNTYSSGFINYILWNASRDRCRVSKDSRISTAALNFMVALSKKVDMKIYLPIDLKFFYEKTGRPLTRKLRYLNKNGVWAEKDGYWAYAENLRKAIMRDSASVLMKINVRRFRNRVEISVPLPEREKAS